jgi:hypothetical protein
VTTRADGSTTTVIREESEEITVCPYGPHAGKTKFDKSIKRDKFNNVAGPEYDLSPDNAFAGQCIVVLQLYTGEGFTFASPKAALEKKGFKVNLFTSLPTVPDFLSAIKVCCQLWIISGSSLTLNDDYMPHIKKLVERKKGLFLWGDNDPFNADAEFVLAHLEQTDKITLKGNYVGDKLLSEVSSSDEVGFTPHLVLTGIESIYEGITISAVRGPTSQFRPLMRSSDGQVVTALHGKQHQRILIDGGYTRLCEDKWARTAGTSRFVTNAACWLYNFEGRVQKKEKKQEPNKKHEKSSSVSKAEALNPEALNVQDLLRLNGGAFAAKHLPSSYEKKFGVPLSYKEKGITLTAFMANVPGIVKSPPRPPVEGDWYSLAE